ncbi:hypothetical protein EYF80_026090 [Liparis tanakae]|uniref:Uncharacterized protein n=1 Tax=Liparis tanakae TaxID=230148 RepID=A0A4Z2HFT6_9TELE|nr:hypothetical protein EYF80_026090 [Liparis tanakae]
MGRLLLTSGDETDLDLNRVDAQLHQQVTITLGHVTSHPDGVCSGNAPTRDGYNEEVRPRAGVIFIVQEGLETQEAKVKNIISATLFRGVSSLGLLVLKCKIAEFYRRDHRHQSQRSDIEEQSIHGRSLVWPGTHLEPVAFADLTEALLEGGRHFSIQDLQNCLYIFPGCMPTEIAGKQAEEAGWLALAEGISFAAVRLALGGLGEAGVKMANGSDCTSVFTAMMVLMILRLSWSSVILVREMNAHCMED